MAKIIGNTTATSYPRPDWNQYDETKADYVKNKTHGFKYNEVWCRENVSCSQGGSYDDKNKHYNYSRGINISIPLTELTFTKGKKYICENNWAKYEFVFDDGYYSGRIVDDICDCGYVSLEISKSDNNTSWNIKFNIRRTTSFGPMAETQYSTLKIYEGVDVPLDKKYLPDDVEFKENKVTEFTGNETDEQYPSAKVVVDHIIDLGMRMEDREDKANKITAFTEYNAIDEYYPSAKAVVDYVGGVHTDVLEQIQRLEEDCINSRFAQDEQIEGKEDLSNKVDNISNIGSTNDIKEGQYPTVKAVMNEIWARDTLETERIAEVNRIVEQNMKRIDSLEDEIDACGGYELIEEVTLEQAVQRVNCDLKGGRYKELYIRFEVPTMNPDKNSSFAKGRSYVYVQNNTTVYDDGSAVYEDTGTTWRFTQHLTMIGNVCVCERKTYTINPMYTIGNTAARWGHTIGVELDDEYLSELSVLLYPANTRLFPAETTYKLWGVKA